MTKPLWRKWFKDVSHAISFTTRAFFATTGAAYNLARNVKNSHFFARAKSFMPFKSNAFIVTAGTVLTSLVIVVIVFATTAKAEKEVHAYIMPSYVMSEGVDNPNAVLAQDLSVDARFVDFTNDFSSRIAFGIFSQTIEESILNETNSNSTSSSSTTLDVVESQSATEVSENNSPELNVAPEVLNNSTGTISQIINRVEKFVRKNIRPDVALAEEAPIESEVVPPPALVQEEKIVESIVASDIAPEAGVDVPVSADPTSPPAAIDEKTSAAEDSDRGNVDRDPFKVASCTTFSKDCHMIVLEGFGVGSELSKYPVRNADLKLSLAGRASPSENPDRVILRSYHNGSWDFLGEQVVRGEFDNAMRGGYLTFPLQIESWSDLASMVVSVEYVREDESDSIALIDAVWVDVGFEADESPDDLALLSPNVKNALLARDAERRALERDRLDLGNGKIIDFKNTMSDLPSSKLRVATTKSKHAVLGSGEEYVSVTNFSNSAERIHLSFHFPEDGGRVTGISHFLNNSSRKVVESKTSPIAFFCASGWSVASSTDDVVVDKSYVCPDTNEPHICSSLNEDKTNCISEITSIGQEETTVFRRGFEQGAIFSGAFSDNKSLIGKALDNFLGDMPENIIPSSSREVSYSNTFDVEPGTTKYFHITFDTPINSRGDIYVEASADSGVYGLAKTEFDGSWNWRIPVDIGLPYSVGGEETAVPLSLNNMPQEFWERVLENGADIRFTDEDSTFELPFWIANFKKSSHEGLIWVKMPKSAGVMPRVFLYAGNGDAAQVYNPSAPFTTASLTDRAMLVSKSGEDVSVSVTSLAPLVRVSINDGEERSLYFGETALFEAVQNAAKIKSTGPISARASSVFGRATIVPLGAAATNVAFPEGSIELATAPAQAEPGAVQIRDNVYELSSGAIFRTPIMGEYRASSSVPAIFVAEEKSRSTILSDTNANEKLSISSSVVLNEKADSVRGLCSGDRSFSSYDIRGSLLSTNICNGVMHGPFEEGTLFRVQSGSTSSPFSAIFSAIVGGNENVIIGSDNNSRTSAGYDPEVAFGEPEYVTPGEHRRFDLESDKERAHITRFISKKREFAAEEVPTFRFQYKPQSNTFFRKLRSLVGIPPFKVEKVVVEYAGQPTEIKTKVEYNGNFEWTVKFEEGESMKIAPGKLTLRMTISEGLSEYEDAYDFYWGLLAVNFNKAVYEQGETASISLGALSETGNTVCNAKLKLFITDSASSTQEVSITPSSVCNGNEVVDVPDYTATYTPVDSGNYSVRLIRLDDQENILAEVRDSFKVVSRQKYIIERIGPTRINPTSPYSMTLRVVARESYEGRIVERIPADFEVLERGGSTLEWTDEEHTSKSAVWDVSMNAGEVYQYTYKFDAPDKFPFIYFLGPATIGEGDDTYTEPRKWMIASDAAGNMLIYWDSGSIPIGWTCVSCLAGDPFYQRYPMGSSTPSVNGGATTHAHTLTTSVGSAIYSSSINVGGTSNLTLVYKDHVHAFTPTVGVGSNLPPSTSLRILRANATGEVQAPSGAIMMFESAPGGVWSTYSTLDGTFPYGDSGIFNTQGTATHNHGLSGTLGAYSGGTLYRSINNGTNPFVANTTHGHVLTATTTENTSNLPPYATYMMGKSSALGNVPNGAITMWDNDPASGWIHLSTSGSVLADRFVRVNNTAGATGGNFEHGHSDIIGAPAGAANASTRSQALTGPFGSNPTHTHTVDFTSISTVSNLPPYRTVVFAKRSVGVPEFHQEDFRFYDNVNDPLPTDPWPADEVDIAENMSIEDVAYRIKPGNTFRVRMAARITNATSTIGSAPLKLQYSTDGVCSSALNWNDVGSSGSGAPLRGFDNNLVNDGVTLASNLLSTSTPSALQYYSESSTGTPFVREAGIGTIAEFDWVLNANSNLASSSRYCLRMVESSGKVFGSYNKFPSFLTNSAPNAPVLLTQFNHAKLMSLTPTLTFSASDDEGNPIHYAIEIDDNDNFSSPNVAQSTTNASANFTNLANPSNKAPYTNADTIQYQVQSGALSNNVTYWWRVKAMDPTGSTQYGDWSSPRAFTIDTSITTSAWFQTTDAQFLLNERTGVSVSGNAARLAAGSTTGSMYSPEVVFNEGPFGTVWGSLAFSDDGGSGITYQIEYKDASDAWILVPDSVLPSNSTGFGASPILLTSIDPLYYPSIRLRANYTNSGTPVLNDWTLSWAYKTLAPIVSDPFNHAKVSTTTPTLLFASTDPLGRTITYEVQYSTDPTFAASTTCNSGGACAAGFKNETTVLNNSPFISGDTISFKFQSALTNGTTYFWRARGYGTGGGAWSFWSETRAFTVDTSATTYPTWFQTMRGQWNMDTLSGAYANTANSVAVATTSDRVLISYGKGSSDKPKYRFYESGALSSEKDMLSIGSTVLWTVAKTSLINDQYIVGTMGANRVVKFQVFENGIWSRLFTLANSSPSAQRRSYDIAYESISGKAMAVSCSGTDAVYAIFDGSTWGAVQNLDLPFTTNCELVKMASSPTQNQIIALFRNTGSSYHAEVWTGTQWSNGFKMDFSANAGTNEPSHDTMAIEYDRGTGRALAVTSRAGSTNGFRYRVWSGNNWGTEGGVTTLGEGGAIAQLEWAQLKRDPTSDSLMLCGISQYSTTDDGAYTDFIRWTSGAPGTFAANKLGEYYPLSRHAQSMDCSYETKAGRSGRLLYVGDESWTTPGDGITTLNRTTWDSYLPAAGAWQSGQASTGRRWDTAAGAYNWTANETWTSRVERASQSGDIIAISLTRNALNYIFRMWNGTTWSSAITLAGSSVTTRPYGQPFDLVAQQGLTQGHVFSEEINFADGDGPSWREARFAVTKPVNTNVLVSVEYLDGSDWVKIPDAVIPGNAAGTSTSPIDLRNVNSGTYNKIRLRADLSCNGLTSCPTLNDWTVEWTEGLTISGIARASDRTTPITSGTVKIAVDGVEQIGKTGTINGSGAWSISGVNYMTGETVTAWIDNPGVSNRAAAIVKFAGAGNLANVELSRKWLTLGDSGQSGQTISNTDIKLFDNNNESGTTRADIFFNVDNSNNLLTCNTGNCGDFSLAVATGTTWRPNSASAISNSTYSLVVNGALNADSNTIKIGGDWLNSGSFSSGNSNVVFNATSSTHTINSAGAALYKFNNVTFGEANTPAVWQLTSPLYLNGDLNINYGTLSPLAQGISIEKSLSIGTNGLFTKGTATTTFLGTALATLSDLTVAGQDLGIISIDGSPKQLSLSSSAKATSLTIASGDTFSFGVNTLTLLGNFVNNGIVSPNTGGLVMNPVGSATIKQSGYSLNNITVSGGNISWIDTSATSTGNITINGGSVTFPTNAFAVAGSFNQTAGSFVAPLTLIMNANSPGKQISSISNFSNLSFEGTGSWAFMTNATSTGNVLVSAGTVTLPSGQLSVSGNFVNTSGNINGGGGILRMTGVSKNITLNGASLSSITVGTGGSVTVTDTNATTTGSVIAEPSSTFNFPSSGSLTVGGSLINNGTMNANASILYMNRSVGTATISAGSMVLSGLVISGGGNFTINGNTRVSSNMQLQSVGSFTMQNGFELRVDGFFTNSAVNANTTWTGSTLRLTSGATMPINSKVSGGDDYNNVILDGATQLRLWNSSILGSITTNASSGIYAQNWGSATGSLHIYGTYFQNSGTAYFDYAKDFDGTPLTPGNERAVSVVVANNAILNFATSSSLEIVGSPNATSSISSSGIFAINLASTTLTSSYASIRGMNAAGVNISGGSLISTLNNTDFIVDTNNGYAMTLSRDVIIANNGKQFTYNSFDKGAVAVAKNINVLGAVTTDYIRFKLHKGDIDGELNGTDPGGNPGEVRWDDSNYLINISGTVYSDAGVTPMDALVCDDVTPVVKVKVTGGGTFSAPCGAGGAYTIPNVSFTGETIMSVYLSGAASKAVTVTRGASVDLTGIKLYENRIILRHEDVLPMTISALSGFDADDDADMLFTANGNVLNIPGLYEFWMWTGKTFRPGGDIITGAGGTVGYGGAFHIDNSASFIAEGNPQITIGGRFQADASSIFDAASSTVYMNPSDVRTINATAPIVFNNLRFTGTGTSSLAQAITVNGTLDITSGGLIGVGNITAVNNATGDGTLSMTGGTFTMLNGGLFGGSKPWTTNNLTFGDGITSATTTKNGTATTTVRGVLTTRLLHHFDMGGMPLVLSGSNNVLSVLGSINTTNSTITYSPTSNSNVAKIDYYNLAFAGAGTSTLPSMNLTVNGDFIVGGGSSTVKVNASTNDPAITIYGNVIINSGAKFTASEVGDMTVNGSWSNAGTFVNSSGRIIFEGFGSKTINSGGSSFGSVLFADNLGSWTITQNATATSMMIGSSTSWTLAPTKTLEITGNFQNLVGGANTTWTNTTLYLNTGTRDEVNRKDIGEDIYDQVRIGSGTQAIFWNSSSTQFITASGGGVLSADHAGVDGDLYIFGNYSKDSGNEYWNYYNDFDGEVLNTGELRAARIMFAAGATANYSGSSNLEIVGKNTGSTTVSSVSGSYGLTISGASTTMQYVDFSGMNSSGVQLSGSVKVGQMDDVVFRNTSGAGSMMTIAGSVITANPLRTTYRNEFISTGGTNITVTGSTASAWRIRNHYGGRDGEAYDTDPAGDPGYIIWDDSAAQIYISGHVYNSDGVTVSSICNGITQNVALKVEGAGSLTSACSIADGSYSIGPVVYAPYDTLAVYATNSGVAYAYRPMTNIADMDLYQNTVILRNEQGDSITSSGVNSYDKDNNAIIPVRVTGANMVLDSNTKLIVWNSKSFAPGGNVSVPGNTNISSIDGDVELRSNSEWRSNGAEQYTVGGDFTMGSNAQVVGSGGEFIFTSTVAGKAVSAATPATISSMNFNGSGNWAISGIATSTGNVRIQAGSVTLPNGSLSIAGDFNNQSIFSANNGTLVFTATTTGKQIRSNGSNFGSIIFKGTGGWNFLDSATTTMNFTIASGTPVLPSGSLSIGNDFENIGGSFNSNGGTVIARGSGTRKITPGGSSLHNLRIENGDYSTGMQNATSTGDVIIASGSLDLPVAQFAIGGTFRNTGTFIAGATSTVKMMATTTGKIINPGASEFNNLIIDGAGGGFTVEANATVNKSLTIKSGAGYVQSPATRLVVKDNFINNIGGTWTGSTLRLEKSGTSTINSKTDIGAAYNNVELGPNTQISSWKSSFGSVTPEAGASLYSQNDNNTNGSLRIYGNYTKTSGSDYWSSTREFDGSVIAARTVSVRIANGSTVSYSNGASLNIVGDATRISSVQSISGTYALSVNDGSFNGDYFKIRNTTTDGLQLLGATTIVSLNNADLATGVNTGKILSIDASVVDQNTGITLSNDGFALDSGHVSGTNIYLNGVTSNAITLTSHFGGIDGEAYDSDGGSACGAFRWDDSSCQFVDQRYYRWRNDDGNESVPDNEWYGGAASGWTHRQRIHVVNNGTSSATNVAIKVPLPYQSQMRSDFADIRFTSNDGVTLVPYWIEKYNSATDATVWAKVPSIASKSSYDLYVYYGNSGASSASNGPNTFTYIYDAESGMTGMTGDTSSFLTSNGPTPIPAYNTNTSPYYLRANDMGGMTNGMANTSAGVSRGATIRERIYINGSENDDTCLTFGVGATISNNWAFCVSPLQAAKNVRLVKNATKDGFSPNILSEAATTDITLSTAGWYSARIDWEDTGKITAWLYDPSGSQVATITATDGYNPGSGIGFTYWYQHGAWENVIATPFLRGDPTVLVFSPQQHGGATWLSNENTSYMTATQNSTMRLRFGIRNTGTPLTDQQLRLDFAAKGVYSNCESVPDGNYAQVPTAASCGGSHICMATSSWFGDNDATSPLLSTPKGLNFVSGRMVESPSNSTPGYNIPGNSFTEVEYAMRFTGSAMLPAYCMRVSDNGSRLVSYTKVAEAAVLQAPSISNWSWNASPLYLNEGTTTRVTATGTITDFNGAADIATVTGSVYRSGVGGGASCTPDDNNCYSGAKTSCSLSSCDEFSCVASCFADLNYFAEKTDYGDYASEDWKANISVVDSQGLSDTDTDGAELIELKALSLNSSTINYGGIDVGSSTSPGLNPKITLSNTGNTTYSLQLLGSDLTAPSSLISVDNQKFATSTFNMSACTLCSTLASTTPVSFGLTLPKPVSTVPVTGDIYFGIQVPYGTKALDHNGEVSISAE